MYSVTIQESCLDLDLEIIVFNEDFEVMFHSKVCIKYRSVEVSLTMNNFIDHSKIFLVVLCISKWYAIINNN